MLTWGVSARFPVSCNILIRIENIVFISKEKSYDFIVKVFQENPECIISKGGGSRSRVRTVKSCGEWERHLKKKNISSIITISSSSIENYPAVTYLFKVHYGNTRLMCEIC